MQTPPNSFSNSDSAFDIRTRMIQRLHQIKVDNQLIEILQQFFEKELDQEHIVLSHPERTRMFRQVTKAVLTEMLSKIDRDQ